MKPLMIIGGKSYQETPYPRLGGTTVLLDNLLDYCDNNNIPYVHVSTNKHCGSRFSSVINYFSMLWNVLKNARKCSLLMVNISSKYGTLIMLPYVVIVAKLFGLPAVCRKFAGSLHQYLEARSYRKRIVLWCLNQTKVSFFETKELLDYFHNNGIDATWFPNVRKCELKIVENKSFTKNFVFISRVQKMKGIDYLIKAFALLGPEYKVDIYGPIEDYKPEDLQGFNYEYKGLLNSNEVVTVMQKYDALIIPTFWSTEGYPGAVLEAYAAGVPVIISKIGGIPEIVQEGITGFLTEPKNPGSVVDAVKTLGKMDCNEVSRACREYFDNTFNSDIVNERIIKQMIE